MILGIKEKDTVLIEVCVLNFRSLYCTNYKILIKIDNRVAKVNASLLSPLKSIDDLDPADTPKPNEGIQQKKEINEELKKLRYSHHRTAFDVDIDNLDSHPWRNKNADISDYFNYGFNEKTWQV